MDSSGYTRGDLRATGSYFLTEETIKQIKEFSQGDSPTFTGSVFGDPMLPIGLMKSIWTFIRLKK